ncbi:MAG: ACT domain-containing protein [bacterium]
MLDVRKQISIFLANRPGTLADVCEELDDQNINILAMTVSDTVDHAVVRMLVDKPGEAVHRLEDQGLLVVENDVLTVDLKNRPGALAGMARDLADNGINIEYAYCTASPAQQKGMMIIRMSDPEEARELLESDIEG